MTCKSTAQDREHAAGERLDEVRAMLTRRHLIAGGASLALLATAGGRHRVAASASHGFAVGEAKVTVLSDGVFSLPADMALGAIAPDDLAGLKREAGIPEINLELQTNVVVIAIGAARVLVDCGAGPDFVPSLGRLPDRLAAAGLAPASITHVVFTHAHADHLWGAMDEFGEGPRFDKARHVMTGVERDHWLGRDLASVPDRVRGMAAGTQRRLKLLGDRIEPVKAGSDPAPGVTLVDTAGHTPGHVSVLVRSGGQSLMIGGDALTHPLVSFARPGWRWGSDQDPDTAVAARLRLLDLLARDQVPLLGYHHPWPGLARVEKSGSAYRRVPV